MAAELAILAEGVRKRFGDVVAGTGVARHPRGDLRPGRPGRRRQDHDDAPPGGALRPMRASSASPGMISCATRRACAAPRLPLQRFSMYGELTVAENIAFFAEMFGVPGQPARAIGRATSDEAPGALP